MFRTLLLGLTTVATSALAGSQSGTVEWLNVRASDGLISFVLTGEKQNRPACDTQPYWLIKDENSEQGKQQYSMLLAAASSGRTISISGTGACERWGDGESVNDIRFYSNPQSF